MLTSDLLLAHCSSRATTAVRITLLHVRIARQLQVCLMSTVYGPYGLVNAEPSTPLGTPAPEGKGAQII